MTMSDESGTANVFTVSADDGVNPFGQAVIEKGQHDVTLYNKSITTSSLVYITSVSELKGQNLFVKQVSKGFVIIGLTSEAPTDVYFNWLVKTPTVTIN